MNLRQAALILLPFLAAYAVEAPHVATAPAAAMTASAPITEAIEDHRPEVVTWDNVDEMRASGLCELASHSHIHGHMERLTEAMNRREVTLSREIIEERTGVRAETFVFPFGGHNQRVMGLVEEAGYRAAFAVGTGRVRLDSPRWALPRKGVLRSTTLSDIAVLFTS